MIDMMLPPVCLHPDTGHISLSWKQMFGAICKEEHEINARRAAMLITSPSTSRSPTKYTIRITAEFLRFHQNNIPEDSDICKETLKRRR